MLVSSCLVFTKSPLHAGRLRVLLCRVQRLEDPGQAVHTEVEERAAGEVWVDHSMAVVEGVFGRHGHRQVGARAVDGADLA